MPNKRKVVPFVGRLLIILGIPAFASPLDLGPREPAVRAGVSLEPDQFHVGIQAQIGPTRRLSFRPSLDLGVGNGVRLGLLNADVVSTLGRATKRFRPYVGAGPALAVIDVTSGVGEARGIEVDLVGHVAAGVVWARVPSGEKRFFLEARAGFGDTPDLKLTAGIYF